MLDVGDMRRVRRKDGEIDAALNVICRRTAGDDGRFTRASVSPPAAPNRTTPSVTVSQRRIWRWRPGGATVAGSEVKAAARAPALE